MSAGRIRLNEGRANYAPGETVSGYAAWELATAPKAVSVHLLWYTESAGGTEAQVVESRRFEQPGPMGREQFAFVLPGAPSSFSGRLFSIHWALELVLPAGHQPVRQLVVCGPQRRSIQIEPEGEAEPSGLAPAFS